MNYKPSWKTGEGIMFYAVIATAIAATAYLLWTTVQLHEAIVNKALALATTPQDIATVSALSKSNLVETLKPLAGLLPAVFGAIQFAKSRNEHKRDTALPTP